MTPRRIVAVVLSDLLIELAASKSVAPDGRRRVPFSLGVLLVETPKTQNDGERTEPVVSENEAEATAVLAAVNETAARYGVRTGQTVAEAHALVARLVVREVTREEVQARLGEIAEVGLAFGPTVAIEAPDTVWIDVTGAAHLAGGEAALAAEIGARVRALGHVVRVAISTGPHLSRALARWGKMNPEGACVVEAGETARRIAELPVKALPIDGAIGTWLVRLGVHTVGDLARLPRAAAAARLENDAGRLLDLAEGKDDAPLVSYSPPSIPKEEVTWDDPVSGVEPLLFVLRGLVARLGARLEGRGEAVQMLELVVMHDPSVARFEKVEKVSTLSFELATPLYRSEEMFRVVSSRLSRKELPAPAIGVRLEAHAITRALSLQLDLSRYGAGLSGSAAKGPETLPVLISELVSDLGKDKVGVLKLEGSHRPERKSRLASPATAILSAFRKKTGKKSDEPAAPAGELPPRTRAHLSHSPTRLLVRPLPFEAPLKVGATLSIEHRLYSIVNVRFERRLESIEWWTPEPLSRDYARVWLESGTGGLEAVVYVDRNTGQRKIHGFLD